MSSVAERFSLTVEDVAAQLAVCEETVRRLVRCRALRAYRTGSVRNGPLRFSQADVESYIARRRL